jgi:hypothetical protein
LDEAVVEVLVVDGLVADHPEVSHQGPMLLNFFSLSLMIRTNKLECLSLATLYSIPLSISISLSPPHFLLFSHFLSLSIYLSPSHSLFPIHPISLSNSLSLSIYLYPILSIPLYPFFHFISLSLPFLHITHSLILTLSLYLLSSPLPFFRSSSFLIFLPVSYFGLCESDLGTL